MKWGQDKLVDQLIANNAARPRPGMDTPVKEMISLPRRGPQPQSADAREATDAELDGGRSTDGADQN